MKSLVLLCLCLSLAATRHAVALDRKGIIDNGPTSLTEQSAAQLRATISDFQNLGVAWVRLDFDWSVMQPAPQRYAVARYDAVVTALHAAGINVLGLIAYTPAWARRGKASKFFPPDHPDDYAKFAGYLAARYAPLGVHAWEIWNEENLAQFWQPAPSPPEYVRLLRQAYQAIHAAAPDAVVLLGGLAQPRNTATSIASLDFLREAYREGAGSFLDAVADHPYSSPRMPRNRSTTNNWQRMFATSPSLHGIMSENGDTLKKIWVTEYGAPTAGSKPGNQAIVISEDQQALMLKEAYELVKSYAWAGPLFWYEYQDLCPAGATSANCFYGMVRFDGSRKPAYAEYGSAPNE